MDCITVIGLLVSILGLLISVISIFISFKIYNKQCRHIYKLNYNKIAYSSMDAEIMNLQNKIIDEIEACVSDMKCYMKNSNFNRLDAEDEMHVYITTIGELILNYTSTLSSYIDALLECNEYKKNNSVNTLINVFNNNINELGNSYTLSKFKDINGSNINFTLQSASAINSCNIFECIYNSTVDAKSFENMMNHIKMLVVQVQRIEKNGYIFTIQDIKYLLDKENIDVDSYNFILNNYNGVI